MTIRRVKDYILLLLKLAWSIHRVRSNRQVVFGLWFQRGTKSPILRVEYPGYEIHVGKIRKPSSRQGALPEAARKWLFSMLRAAERTGVKFVVWGFFDVESIGTDLSDVITVRRVENGLFAPGVKKPSPIFSYVIDDRSLYFNGREETDIERILNAAKPGEWRTRPEGEAFIDYIRRSNFQKYHNNSEELAIDLTSDDMVVVGQCAGDGAWTQTEALVADNIGLLRQATESISHRNLYYKPHPFNRANRRELPIIQSMKDVRILPASLSFAEISHRRPIIAVNTSGAGLEAALRGAKIHTFGTSFYSHWGFTEDRTLCPRRQNRLTPEDVFYNLIFHYHRLVRREDLAVIDPLTALRILFGHDRASKLSNPTVEIDPV